MRTRDKQIILRLTEKEYDELKVNVAKTNLSMQAYLRTIIAGIQPKERVPMNLFEKFYEDNVNGKVTDEWFMQLSHKYEVERMNLKQKIQDLQIRLHDMDHHNKGRERFIAIIRKLMELQTLTPAILRGLIDRIEIYETEGSGKNRTQRVVIFYRFIGYLELPEGEINPNYKADLRRGVAVEYVPKLPA